MLDGEIQPQGGPIDSEDDLTAGKADLAAGRWIWPRGGAAQPEIVGRRQQGGATPYDISNALLPKRRLCDALGCVWLVG